MSGMLRLDVVHPCTGDKGGRERDVEAYFAPEVSSVCGVLAESIELGKVFRGRVSCEWAGEAGYRAEGRPCEERHV